MGPFLVLVALVAHDLHFVVKDAANVLVTAKAAFASVSRVKMVAEVVCSLGVESS